MSRVHGKKADCNDEKEIRDNGKVLHTVQILLSSRRGKDREKSLQEFMGKEIENDKQS